MTGCRRSPNMNRVVLLLIALAMIDGRCFAMKNASRTFDQTCDAVWTASVAVAKGQQYRVVSISKEEQIISLAVGGAWSGERIITLALAPGAERGCTASVQSRFSGLAHSDGPDLLSRINVELVGQTMDRDSKEFHRFKDCVENSPTADAKCESRLHKDINRTSGAAK